MKKIWGYVSAVLAGALAVALLAWRSMGDHYSGKVKFRQRGKGNIQKPSVSLQTGGKTAKNERKQARLEKKKDKIEKKLKKRL